MIPFGMAPIGTAGRGLLDVWSVVHFAFWFVVGADIRALAGRVSLRSMAICLMVAYAWEVAERFLLEPRGLVTHPESLLNRWISDPLMCVVGVAAGSWLIARQ